MARAGQYKGYSVDMDLQADLLEAQQARNAILDDTIHGELKRLADAQEALVKGVAELTTAIKEVGRVNAAVGDELTAAVRFVGNNV